MVLLSLLPGLTVSAQEQKTTAARTVIVVDQAGPVIGASVVIKGTVSGASTDVNGVTTIACPDDAVLSVSYVGYSTQEVAVASRTTIEVRLEEDAQRLDEVVVVGYNTVRRAQTTGALSQVKGEKLEFQSSPTLENRLQGQTPGVMISSGSGQPGSNDLSIRIRGTGSINGSNTPLYIMDGVMVQSADFAALNSNDIADIQVLKDASAVAIYGSRGSNGVILIQTKRGSKGSFHVTYKTKLSVAEPMQRIETMGPNEFIRFKQDMGRLKNNYSGEQLDPLVGSIISASEKVNYAKGITNDWQDYVFRTVFTMDHQLSFQGGNEKTTYMASVSYLDNPGVVYNSNYQRTNVYASINQKMNDWLSVGLTTQFVNRETGGATPNLEHAIKQSPYGIYKDETGAYYEEPMDYSNLPNPMKDVNADQKRTGRNFMANGFLDLKLPVKGLSFRSQFGYNYRSQMNGTYYGRNTVTGKKVDGRAELANNHTTDWTWENVLKFDRNFGKHHIDFTGLFSMQEAQYTAASQSGEGFVNDDSSFYRMDGAENKIAISSSFWKENFVSGMFRVNYGFNSKYLLTLTGRADSFSAFAENHKWAFFPSAAVAWHLGEESFIKDNASWIDMLKIRLSYGANGNNAISRYQSLDRLYSTNGVKYIWGDNSDAANSAYLPSDGIGNPDLRWETTYTANLGIDFQFFNGRLGGTIDMYLSNTHDLLMSRTVPIMNGYSKILYNVGQTRNKGIELTLHSQNIRKTNFRWETDFTFSLNRDQIVALRGDGKDDINNKWFIGQPLSVYYDWNMIGIWQEGDEFTFIDKDGKEVAHQTGATPGAAKLEDVDGNGVIDSNDRKVIGSKQPSFTMSMGNRFTYKDFYFSFLFNGVFGKWMTDNVANISSYTFGSGNYIHGVKYWTPETPDAEVVSPGYQASFSHGYYKKLNYVQLRNITLGYRVNQKFVRRIGLSAIDVNFSVNNVCAFSNMRQMLNYDNTWFASFPTARSYVLGLSLTF